MKSLPIIVLAVTASLTFSAASANTITLRVGHSANASEPYHLGLQRFAEIVSEETNGEVEVEIFPNSQLGSEREMIEGLYLGTIDITVPTNGVVTNFVGDLSIFDLPFLFDDREHMYRAIDGEVGEQLSLAMQEKGIRLLGFYEAGIRHIVTDYPVNSIDDIQGKSIRTMKIPAHVASFNAFGANATPLAYNELYSALEAGVVDGAEAAYTNYESQRFYEVAPYLADVSWTALVADLIMSEEQFQSFPKHIQDALLKAGYESAQYERQLYAESDAQLKQKVIEQGATITEPDVDPFREAAQSVYEEFADTEEEQHLLQLINQAR
ncbi:TRAP transporter substrate-binding protein [Halomonas huangheensis]|uniref:C4-dicarboxylate ABC transporter substrate-binding protein n=1 Tax=Halomonas huangheensis TaxID=1178482 RepID=W1N135_9GAMM|nr:TRAP transporter substrate-binding protein [Halomonas huangheensis]ALM50965.1 hypothetical protein AR456_00630 [Halomonas huangheensis]ERL49209.1 hypothetical protein BJB45_21465 [Halomonas huangheensis]